MVAAAGLEPLPSNATYPAVIPIALLCSHPKNILIKVMMNLYNEIIISLIDSGITFYYICFSKRDWVIVLKCWFTLQFQLQVLIIASWQFSRFPCWLLLGLELIWLVWKNIASGENSIIFYNQFLVLLVTYIEPYFKILNSYLIRHKETQQLEKETVSPLFLTAFILFTCSIISPFWIPLLELQRLI